MKSHLALLASLAGLGLLAACSSGGSPQDDADVSAQDLRRASLRITRSDLVSDQPGAATQDKNLVNAWGIAFNPAGPAWVSNNGSATTTVYDATGKLLLTVSLPAAAGAKDPAAPTGQVFNASAGFSGDKFILADEGGTIAGWQPKAGAQVRVDSTARGAVYKGLAISGARLYATDFHNGKVDVFDDAYAPVTGSCAFADASLPAGFAPFGIQELGGTIFVTYAKQDDAAHDDVKGAGLGYVDAFDTDGNLLGRVASAGALSSPWALALAPASFGPIAGKLLVGNFGDGAVNVYDVDASRDFRGRRLGALLDASGTKLAIDGLWALAVSPSGTLFFSAGPGGEQHGAFGTLTVAAPAPAPTPSPSPY